MEYEEIDGVKFDFYRTAVELVEEGIMLADSHVYTDENGQEQVEPIVGTQQLFPVESIIIAISQGPRAVIVSSTGGIDIENSGLVVTDDCGRTTRAGVFASGDVVTGAKTVVEAVRVSRRVAKAIDQYISGNEENY